MNRRTATAGIVGAAAAGVLAEVVLYAGRYFLCVSGVYLVMEGDMCRDGHWIEKHWSKEMLDKAAAVINAQVDFLRG